MAAGTFECCTAGLDAATGGGTDAGAGVLAVITGVELGAEDGPAALGAALDGGADMVHSTLSL